MNTEYRAGLLQTSNIFPESWIRKTLPPEHRIAGVARYDHLCRVDYVIEGPRMPVVTDRTIPDIRFAFEMERLSDNLCRMFAAFKPDMSDKWLIGEWPTPQGMLAERGEA